MRFGWFNCRMLVEYLRCSRFLFYKGELRRFIKCKTPAQAVKVQQVNPVSMDLDSNIEMRTNIDSLRYGVNISGGFEMRIPDGLVRWVGVSSAPAYCNDIWCFGALA